MEEKVDSEVKSEKSLEERKVEALEEIAKNESKIKDEVTAISSCTCLAFILILILILIWFLISVC